MNKTKRKIIAQRVKLIRRLASELQPLDGENKPINAWYVANLKTPLQAGSEILKTKKHKLNSLFFQIREYDHDLYNINGWLFTVKFPMCIFACKKQIHYDQLYSSYMNFLEHSQEDGTLPS